MQTALLPSPIIIDPDGIYSDGDLQLLLGLTSATLTNARRKGELRHSRKGRQTYYLGQNVIDWLFSEEGHDGE